MSGTLQASIVKDSASSTNNLALDSSGNVTVGNNLTVSGTGTQTLNGSLSIAKAGQALLLNGSTGNYATWQYNGTSLGDIGSANNAVSGGSTADFGLTSRSGNLIFGTSSTERMRIDTSGNVGIGTTSPSSWGKLGIQTSGGAVTGLGIYSPSTTNGALITLYDNYSSVGIGSIPTASTLASGLGFYTASTERMRIDSSGNLCIGLTGGTGRLRVLSGTSDSTTFVAAFYNSGSSSTGYIRSDGLWNTGNISSSPYSNTTATAANVVVDSNGTLYRSTSSLRYKENIQDYGKGLTDLAKLRPVTFTTKPVADREVQDTHTYAGFIAEEVHDAGLTEYVQYNAEGQPDALAYQNMVALLTKSLQETVAKIDALETRIATLEKK
jgi:hypothetical protein